MALNLSKSERDVIRLKCLGLIEKQIADKRCVSLNTIKTQVKRAIEKTGVKNGYELVARFALDNPNIFKNSMVVFFLTIQSFMIFNNVVVEKRGAKTHSNRTVRARRKLV